MAFTPSLEGFSLIFEHLFCLKTFASWPLCKPWLGIVVFLGTNDNVSIAALGYCENRLVFYVLCVIVSAQKHNRLFSPTWSCHRSIWTAPLFLYVLITRSGSRYSCFSVRKFFLLSEKELISRHFSYVQASSSHFKPFLPYFSKRKQIG